MEAIILAGGHATRLYPITLDRPKPLLKINNKHLINYIIEHLEECPDIKKINIITNKKFKTAFEDWASKTSCRIPIKVISNHIIDSNEKFSAVDNIKLVIDNEKIDTDCLVVAGDGIFNFSIGGLINKFKEENKTLLLTLDLKNPEDTKPFNNVIVNENGEVLNMREKPADPTTGLIAICYYAFKKEDLKLIDKYLEETENHDAPGHFIQWLHKIKPITTYQVENIWFDIGNAKDFLNANKIFTDRSLQTEENVSLIKSKIKGKVYIMKDCTLENSDIEDCIIFENTKINNCNLKNCIIDKNTTLSNVNLHDSVIGPNTNLNHF